MLKFSDLLEAMTEDVKHSEFSGFDVEVKITYVEDAEGVLHSYVEGSPVVKLTVAKHGKEVTVQPYYYAADPEEDSV